MPRKPKAPPAPTLAPAPILETAAPTGPKAQAEHSASAEVLALLAESDSHPSDDGSDVSSTLAPTRYDILPSLYAKLEALVLLAESEPHASADREAPPPEGPIFDPFDADNLVDETPFDPPDEADLSDALASADSALLETAPDAAPVLPPELLAPVRTAPPAPIASANRDYLERARRAAQHQTAMQPPRLLFGVPLEHIEHFKWRIAGFVAAPLLAAGAWGLFAQSENARSEALLTSASAPAPETRDFVGEYRLAMERLENGRTRDGVALLRDLAEAGFPVAQYQLAKSLERGEGAPQSLAQARVWAERAADGGNCRAMHDVGVYYARGEGAPRDEAMAARWFREAAERGVADSQYNLGVLYGQGRGVAHDANEALFWFLVAARNQDLNAIDRAVEVAAGMSGAEVAQIQGRARAFQARAANPIANGVFDEGAAPACGVR